MKVSASTPIPSIATATVSTLQAKAAETQANDVYKPSAKSGPMHTLGRVVTYSTAAALPGVGLFTNFLAASTGVSNVLKQQRGAEKKESLVDGISMGAGVLAALPNVVGMITHQTGWFLASMVVGGIAGAATAYQAKN